mmetsp:Transcript_40592/g.71419  ORF Transcript_40592/g.71419 Transcript_40592/m.71419 type:complete len:477 (-) Transcript_40592:137-1567(-)
MRVFALAAAYLAYCGHGRRVHKIGDSQQSQLEQAEHAERALASILLGSEPSAAWQVANAPQGSSFVQPASVGKSSSTRHVPPALLESLVDPNTQVKMKKNGFAVRLRQGVTISKKLERQRLRREKREARLKRKEEGLEDAEVEQPAVEPPLTESFHPPPPVPRDYEALLKAVVSQLRPDSQVTEDQLHMLMGLYSRDLTGHPFKEVSGDPGRALLNVFGKMAQEFYIVPENPQSLWSDTRPPPDVFTCRLGQLGVKEAVTWLSNDPVGVDKLLLELGFLNETHIGIDTEWTPTVVRGRRQKLSLLQLATDKSCLIIRVGQMSSLPPLLTEVLADEGLPKVGRAVSRDAQKIQQQFNVTVNGLRELTGSMDLKSTAKHIARMNAPRAKGRKGWMTNFDARVLKEETLAYATYDAIAGYRVHALKPRGGREDSRTMSHRIKLREKYRNKLEIVEDTEIAAKIKADLDELESKKKKLKK